MKVFEDSNSGLGSLAFESSPVASSSGFIEAISSHLYWNFYFSCLDGEKRQGELRGVETKKEINMQYNQLLKTEKRLQIV